MSLSNVPSQKDPVEFNGVISQPYEIFYMKSENHNIQIDSSLIKSLNIFSKSLQMYIKKYNIKDFDYSKFGRIKNIGGGGSARVFSAICHGKKYALKNLNNYLFMDKKTFKKLCSELKHLAKTHHPNIIKLYGTSRDPLTGGFMLVLQFANGGTLREYLQNKHSNELFKIKWAELIRIAKEITDGLNYLHSKNIIHLDLHSKNILINNGKALIADFGISKNLDDITSSSTTTQGVVAYTDPQYLLNGKEFKRNKKSDVYSLGVLFWELTSGVPPFRNLTSMKKMLEIANNNREKIITGTPKNYSSLFERCWSSDPNQRPTVDKILVELEKLSLEIKVKFIKNNIQNSNKRF
ncbi:13312_t:CDS:2 [Cetraspora pellucida]|uniref:13312_t:CDS:1 n=1 Tax=Cetraspora pellucida TaxID=1433469 RepID=A0A9N9DB93_9GLOM|nr:13312_t:CDS:2 [Cetraspora pellucida]